MSLVTQAKHAIRHDIQGMRGIAVLLVVLYHAGFPLAPAGFIGVDIFFVISGFLITGLLAREASDSGRIALLRFFSRRIKRLLPAALVLLLFVFVGTTILYPPLEQRDIFSAGRAAVLYLANFWFAGRAVDYLGGDAASNPTLHMWSLAVEEQFYIVWPLIVAGLVASAAAARRQLRLLGGVALISAVSLLACIWMTWHTQPWAFFGMPFRAWEFGIGGLACLFGERLKMLPLQARTVLAALGGALILAGVVLLTDAGLFPGVWAILPAGGTALLLASLHGNQPSPQQSVLSSWPLVRMGDISYSWYLWHWPLLVFAEVMWPRHSPVVTGAVVAASIAIAFASYRWVENPIRNSKALADRNILVIGSAATASIVIGLLLTLIMAQSGQSNSSRQQVFAAARNDIPAVYAAGCHANFDATDLPECVFGDPHGSKTIVLFGDSHAAHWFPAVEQLARQNGWRLVSLTKSSCPSVDVEVYSTAKRRTYHECATWREKMLERIVAAKPSLVVIANSSRQGVSAPDWQAGVQRALKHLNDAGIAVALIRDNPRPGFDAPQCLARMDWQGRVADRECSFSLETVRAKDMPIYAAEQQAAAATPGSFVLDLTPAICPNERCQVYQSGIVRFSDSNHLTAGFVARLAPALAAALHAASGQHPQGLNLPFKP